VNRKWRWGGGIALVVLVLDLWTKSWALGRLGDGSQIQLLGGLLPLTLAFNRGAAFGITIGDDPRWVFIPLTFVAIGFLIGVLKTVTQGDWVRVLASGLVLGGALGNLYDRVRWSRGVVDFIGPVNLGFTRFPIFNIADIGITCGAILLAISFWREDVAAADAAAAAPTKAD
jgi:signal peptidase II